MTLNQKIRVLAINLLDDEHGINEDGFDSLTSLCHETSNQDILDAVESSNGRYYLGEDDAEVLRTKELTGN